LLIAAAPFAQAASVTAYDLGYASQAAERCPGVTLSVPVTNEDRSNKAFVEGAAVVDDTAKKASIETACKFALRLDNSENGKVAKILKTD
jgi:hypothetical protein